MRISGPKLYFAAEKDKHARIQKIFPRGGGGGYLSLQGVGGMRQIFGKFIIYI